MRIFLAYPGPDHTVATRRIALSSCRAATLQEYSRTNRRLVARRVRDLRQSLLLASWPYTGCRLAHNRANLPLRSLGVKVKGMRGGGHRDNRKKIDR